MALFAIYVCIIRFLPDGRQQMRNVDALVDIAQILDRRTNRSGRIADNLALC